MQEEVQKLEVNVGAEGVFSQQIEFPLVANPLLPSYTHQLHQIVYLPEGRFKNAFDPGLYLSYCKVPDLPMRPQLLQTLLSADLVVPRGEKVPDQAVVDLTVPDSKLPFDDDVGLAESLHSLSEVVLLGTAHYALGLGMQTHHVFLC